MTGWALFWYYVIVAAVVSYFSLAAVVAVGGFFDLGTMFRRLDEERAGGTISEAELRDDSSSPR